MPIHTCERCLKEFKQKSHYKKHMERKNPCKYIKIKIEEVDNIIIDTKLIPNNEIIEEEKMEHAAKSPKIISTKKTKRKLKLVESKTKVQTIINDDCINGMNQIESDSVELKTKVQTIINDDCINGMKQMESDSVDIIICDPPYNIGKDFGNDSDKQDMDKYLLWCDEWIGECVRVLKPKGTLYIYGFSEILSFIRVRININVRWIIWHYMNKVTPSLNFWQRTHESILCCYKEKPLFNRDDVREPYSETFLKNAAGKVRKATKGRFSNGEKETIYKAHENGALPRDVIKISALSGGAGKRERVDHPTQKPLALCEKLIKASKNGDDTLLVIPFAGSGSECVAAKKENINFIGYEINSEYVKLCNERLETI